MSLRRSAMLKRRFGADFGGAEFAEVIQEHAVKIKREHQLRRVAQKPQAAEYRLLRFRERPIRSPFRYKHFEQTGDDGCHRGIVGALRRFAKQASALFENILRLLQGIDFEALRSRKRTVAERLVVPRRKARSDTRAFRRPRSSGTRVRSSIALPTLRCNSDRACAQQVS